MDNLKIFNMQNIKIKIKYIYYFTLHGIIGCSQKHLKFKSSSKDCYCQKCKRDYFWNMIN